MNTNNREINDTLNTDSAIDLDIYIRKATQARNEAIREYSLNAVKAVLGLGTSIMAVLSLPKTRVA